MKVVWLIVNTIASSWLNYTVLMNPIVRAAMRKWGGSAADRTRFALLSTLTALHFAIAIAVCLFVSVSAAVVVTSLAAFGCALMSYFLLQRFADMLSRPVVVIEHPMFYTYAALGGFISSNLAIIFVLGWRWVFLPVALWLLLGFLCAEITIRRYMREDDDSDRERAIFMTNEAQGRKVRFNNLFKKTPYRYPFP